MSHKAMDFALKDEGLQGKYRLALFSPADCK